MPRTNVERSERWQEIYQNLGQLIDIPPKASLKVLARLMEACPEHANNELLFSFLVREVKKSRFILNAADPDMEAVEAIVRCNQPRGIDLWTVRKNH